MASVSVELCPFEVPTKVTIQRKPGLRQDGFQPPQTMPLSDLGFATLDALCNEFRANVFAAAGVQDF